MKKLAGFILNLSNTSQGPLLATDDPEHAALAYFVNQVVKGAIPDYEERLNKGETISYNGGAIAQPPSGTDITKNKKGFLRVTDVEFFEDSFHVRSQNKDGILYSRDTVLEIINILKRLQIRWQVIRRDELQKILFDQIGSNVGHKLFTVRPTENQPVNSEKFALRLLEKDADRLAKLEALPKKEQTLEVVVQASVIRRFLLVELEAMGLLNDHFSEAKRHWLKVWDLQKLVTYFDAACEMLRYLRSPERKQWCPDAPLYPIFLAPISLDWFRLKEPIPQTVTKGINDFGWLASCEHEFQRDAQTRIDGNGWFLLHFSGGINDVFYWRSDNGSTPALLRVTSSLGAATDAFIDHE